MGEHLQRKVLLRPLSTNVLFRSNSLVQQILGATLSADKRVATNANERLSITS